MQYQNGHHTVYPIIFQEQYGSLSSINCFLYDNGSTLTLIDAGLDTPQFNEFFQQQLKQYKLSIQDIDQIFLTHHHDDHTGQVNQILSQKQVQVYAHHLAIPRLLFEEQYLTNKYNFFVKIYGEYGCLDISADRFKKMEKTFLNRENLKLNTEVIPLHHGDIINEMYIIEAPGHSPDSIIFSEQPVRWQFSGDLLLENAPTNALIDFDEKLELLPTVSQYRESLLKLNALEAEWIFPGHEKIFQNHNLEIDNKLKKMDRKEQRIIDAVRNGNNKTVEIARAIYGKKVETQTFFVLSEVIGYLEYAIGRGKLAKEMRDGEWFFQPVYP